MAARKKKGASSGSKKPRGATGSTGPKKKEAAGRGRAVVKKGVAKGQGSAARRGSAQRRGGAKGRGGAEGRGAVKAKPATPAPPGAKRRRKSKATPKAKVQARARAKARASRTGRGRVASKAGATTGRRAPEKLRSGRKRGGSPSVQRPARGRRRATLAAPDRITPLLEDELVEELDEFGGPIRPSRIITARPRPSLTQVNPLGSSSGQASLEPWDADDDGPTGARAPEEVMATGTFRPVASPASVATKVEEARAAGWVEDPRASAGELPDARVRFVHPACKYLDGSLVRDVCLSLHGPTGRAALTLEGGDRVRVVSWVMSAHEELPSQIGRMLADPDRLARVEYSSGRELLTHLDDLDRAVADALHTVAASRSDEPVYGRLLEYVRGFAALNSSFGLPSTVDGIRDRFGGRKGSVLKRLELDEASRRRVCDLFDDAVDNA